MSSLKDQFKKKNRKYHAHTTKENESDKEKTTENKESSEEYVLLSSLIGIITHGNDTWIIESGSSKHMTWHKDLLSSLTQKYYSYKVQLGDDYQ